MRLSGFGVRGRDAAGKAIPHPISWSSLDGGRAFCSPRKLRTIHVSADRFSVPIAQHCALRLSAGCFFCTASVARCVEQVAPDYSGERFRMPSAFLGSWPDTPFGPQAHSSYTSQITRPYSLGAYRTQTSPLLGRN